MKSSWSIPEDSRPDVRTIQLQDRDEIDNPNPRHPRHLRYMHRIGKIISIVKRNFPNAAMTKVGEFGCAYANISLLLAESGYDVFGIDINPNYIDYAKQKYERGKIQWVVGNIEGLDFPTDFLDAAISGEMLSVCAHPEVMLERVMNFVRPGGLLIITIPNGDRFRIALPTPRQVRERGELQAMERKQFDWVNLYSFALDDIREMLPRNARILEVAYTGCGVLLNKTGFSRRLSGLLPVFMTKFVTGTLARVPVFNRKTFNTLCVVLQKIQSS